MTFLAKARAAIVRILPAPIVTFLQVIIPPAIAFLVVDLTNGVAHLHGYWYLLYIGGTGLYYSAVSAAERKWPNWAWLFYLLPTELPTD